MQNSSPNSEKKSVHHTGGECPIRDLLVRLGDKWSILVLVALAGAPSKTLRFSEIMREVSGISQRMLTSTLRHMERDGIATRKVYPEVPPRVEYTLTDRGNRLLIPVENLLEWITNEWPEIEQSREKYDEA